MKEGFAAFNKQALPYFGEPLHGDASSKVNSEVNYRYFAGYNVSILDTSTKDNNPENMRFKGYLCMFCDGLMRRPVQIRCGDRACRTCFDHWVYFNRDVTDKAFCPSCVKRGETKAESIFSYDQHNPDNACEKQDSKTIFVARCPITSDELDNKNCSWPGGSLRDLYQHEKERHSSIEADERLWDHYRSKYGHALELKGSASHNASCVALDHFSSGNIASQSDPIVTGVVNSEQVAEESFVKSGSKVDETVLPVSSYRVPSGFVENDQALDASILAPSGEISSNFVFAPHSQVSQSVSRVGHLEAGDIDNTVVVHSQNDENNMSVLSVKDSTVSDELMSLSQKIDYIKVCLTDREQIEKQVLCDFIGLLGSQVVADRGLTLEDLDNEAFFAYVEEQQDNWRIAFLEYVSTNDSSADQLSALDDLSKYGAVGGGADNSLILNQGVVPTTDRMEFVRCLLLPNLADSDEFNVIYRRLDREVLNDKGVRISELSESEFHNLLADENYFLDKLRSIGGGQSHHYLNSLHSSPASNMDLVAPVEGGPVLAKRSERQGTIRVIAPDYMTEEQFNQFYQNVDHQCQDKYGCTVSGMTDESFDKALNENFDTWTLEAIQFCESAVMASATEQSISLLPSGEISKEGMIRAIFPALSDQSIKLMFTVLFEECQLFRRQLLDELSDAEFYDFLQDRLSARAPIARGKIHRIHSGGLNENDVKECFKNYDAQAELRLAQCSSNHMFDKTHKDTRYYRVGTFISRNDEQGKTVNYKLGNRIFEQEDVNKQGVVYGFGLYTANNKKGCADYLRQQYNKDMSVAILEITPKQGLFIIDVESNGIEPFVKQAVLEDRCHLGNAIYKIRSKNYIILKDESSILSIKAFHPYMHAKVHVPYSIEQIEKHGMQQKEIPEAYLSGLKKPKKLKYCTVFSPYFSSAGIKLEVYEYEVKLRREVISNRDLHDRDFELKHIIRVDGKYIRVKIKAPVNTNSIECDLPLKPTEFHVQYHMANKYKNEQGFLDEKCSANVKSSKLSQISNRLKRYLNKFW